MKFVTRILAALMNRRTAFALLAALCAFAVWDDPERLTGRGGFAPLPEPSRSSVLAALAQAGYALPDGAEPVAHRRFFAPLEPLRVVFPGRAPDATGSDLHLARFDGTEGGLRLRDAHAIHPTDGAEEFAAVPLGDSLACVARLEGGASVVTVTDGLTFARRQFLFPDAAPLRDPAPSPLAPELLSLTVAGPDGPSPLLLNVVTGAYLPESHPLEFIPAEAGSEPFIPRLVDQVRNLPFIGSARIAWLQDVFYDAKDRVECALSADEAESADEPAPPVAEERVAPSLLAGFRLVAAEARPHLDALAVAVRARLAVAVAPAPARPPGPPRWLAPWLERGEATLAARIAPALRLADSARAHAEARLRLLAAVPPPIPPVYRKTRPGEGVWRPLGPPAPDGVQALYTTMVRVDPARPFAEVTFASLDLARIDLRLVGGTEEPISETGVKGRGMIPKRAEVYRSLVCSFNGGFRTKHGKWGFIVDGVTLVRPVPGIATVAVDAAGGFHLGEWGTTVDPARRYLQLRQNLPLLVQDGAFNTKNKQWGFAVNNETHIWRSGIGVSPDGRRLIYAAGRSLTAETLARAFQIAGCLTAMELDVNEYHTYFIRYEANEGGGELPALAARLLRDDMRAQARRNLDRYTRDFFYVTWRDPASATLAAE